MKKFIILTAACIAMLTFCACSENTYPQPETAGYTENTFRYGLSNVSAFTVYDGLLYAAYENTSEVQVLDPQGEQVTVYNLGEGYHGNLSYYNGNLYAFTYGDTFHGITVYHCETGTHELYPIDADITSAIAMTIADDHIYLNPCSSQQ